MHLEDFDYLLPAELIAQKPEERRDASRLMTLDRQAGSINASTVDRIDGFFRQGDLLVLNDTRVIPARFIGRKESGGQVELFLVRRVPGDQELWHCLIKVSKKPALGSRIVLPGGVAATVVRHVEGGEWQVSLSPADAITDWIERFGSIPLPPYIRRTPDETDRERYQTVFARHRGAVAAPTAGLHFTEEMLAAIRARGVEIVPLTLHVGLGTFMPVRVSLLSEHRMHREQYIIPEETAQAICRCKGRGGRVIALGTTTTRALEHSASISGAVTPGEGEADIFITPGYSFKVVDALITNFHLPKSTLLMLVAAFAGKEFLLKAYDEAVARRFRFFSYGDAMLIY